MKKSTSPYLKGLSEEDIKYIRCWLEGLRAIDTDIDDLPSEIGKRYVSFYGRPTEYDSYGAIGASIIYQLEQEKLNA